MESVLILFVTTLVVVCRSVLCLLQQHPITSRSVLSLCQARIVMSLLAQRFTFTPVDVVECGTLHEYIVPVVPRSGMNVLVD
jgi:energy-converting hydrogenase Eha subunit C